MIEAARAAAIWRRCRLDDWGVADWSGKRRVLRLGAGEQRAGETTAQSAGA